MKKLTTVFGAPVVDNQNIRTAGPRGPALLEDVWFLEKLAHFDREVIPERRMHAKGSGAFKIASLTTVAPATGLGNTLIDSSRISPSVPSDPASSRETS